MDSELQVETDLPTWLAMAALARAYELMEPSVLDMDEDDDNEEEDD